MQNKATAGIGRFRGERETKRGRNERVTCSCSMLRHVPPEYNGENEEFTCRGTRASLFVAVPLIGSLDETFQAWFFVC